MVSTVVDKIEEKVKISVIIPTYNGEKTIDSCLRGLLNQDFPRNEFEIIVVDDGSRDRTAEKVKKAAEKSGKVKINLIEQKKSGKIYAMYRGAKFAKGEILCVLDADIIVPKSFLKTGYNFLKKNQSCNVIGSIVISKNAKKNFVPAVRSFMRGVSFPGGSNFYRKKWFHKNIRPRKERDLIEPVEYALMEERVLRKLKVYELSETHVSYLFKKSYQAGVHSVLLFKRSRKAGFSAILFSSFPPLLVGSLLAGFSWAFLFLILPYLAMNSIHTIKFYNIFKRKLWAVKFFFIKILMHMATSCGAWKGWMRR